MSSLNYHKCPIYQCDWQSFFSKKNKVKYVKYILDKYPESENLDYVKFSNEIYFRWRLQHQLQIIQKLKK